jgi:hypothetical protein
VHANGSVKLPNSAKALDLMPVNRNFCALVRFAGVRCSQLTFDTLHRIRYEMTLRIHSTSDISLTVLEEFNAQLPSEVRGEVASSQIFLRSADPPSWVTFLADADWWIKALAAWAALYAAEITKQAGKDTWRSRRELLAATRRLGSRITSTFARSVAALTSRLPARTSVRLGVPIPSDHFSTALELTGHDHHDIALDLAVFLVHLPGLMTLIDQRQLNDQAATGVFLTICDNLSLEITWADAETLMTHKVVLSFPSSAV